MKEKLRKCGCKQKGVVSTRIFQDNWFVEHCNKLGKGCGYWKAGKIRN